jgi:hypothetical protein
MAGGSQSADQLALADRRKACVQLRLEGLSFRDIGDRMGISYTQAWNDVSHVLSEMVETTRDQGDELRELEHTRLNQIWEKLYAAFLQVEQPGDLNKISQQLHRNSELRSRLYGLEAAKKIEIETKVTHHIEEFVVYLRSQVSPECFSEVLQAIDRASEQSILPEAIEAEIVEVENDD